METTTVADFLRTISLFEQSSPEHLEQIAAHCVEQQYKPGDLILEQGVDNAAYYFLRHGRVAARVERITGRETVATLDPPTIFGELSCITGEPCSADIEVIYDANVLMLPRDALNEIGRKQPEILLGMVRLLAKRLHTTVIQGARAAEFPVVLLREHPHWNAPVAFSESLVRSLAEQVDKQSLLVRIGDVQAEQDIQEIGTGAFVATWPARAGDEDLSAQLAKQLPQWQERFKSIVFCPTGEERLAIADAIDEIPTDVGELLGPGDPFPTDGDQTRFVVGSGESPQLPLLDGSQQLLFEAAESESACLRGQPVTERFRRTVDSIARHVFRIQVGLACGGGAAWGFAHIGVLKVFQEAGLPIDVVAGNSAGTLIGGMYCCGRSISEIREHVLNLTKSRLKLFEFRIWKMHMIRESTVAKNFERFYGDVHVNQTEIPFWANALNIETGDEINITNGLLRSAVRASICLPGLFPPVVVGDALVIDAGLMDSVPVNQIREMGCRFAISTNVMQELKAQKIIRNYPRNLLHIVYRAMMSQGHEVGAARCERASDVVIKPDAGNITMLGFQHVDKLIECGERAAEQQLALIQAALRRLKARC